MKPIAEIEYEPSDLVRNKPYFIKWDCDDYRYFYSIEDAIDWCLDNNLDYVVVSYP